jgi:hypothetical protein
MATSEIYIKATKVVDKFQRMYEITEINAPDIGKAHPKSNLYSSDNNTCLIVRNNEAGLIKVCVNVGDVIPPEQFNTIKEEIKKAIEHDKKIIELEHLDSWFGESVICFGGILNE